MSPPIDHNKIDALLRSGVQLHQQNRLREAEQAYLEVLRQQPMHPGALHLLGLIALQCGQFQRSVDLFDRAIAIRPDFPEAHDNRGTALYSLNRFEEAAASYDRALKLRPDNAGAQSNRGNVLQTLGRFDQALASYDRAIALKPDFAEAHFGRGATLNALSRPGDALSSHERAIALRPDYAKAFQGRGTALHRLGRFADAVASHDRAIAIAPDFAEAFVDRGRALDALERHEDAVASYDKAIALRPDLAEAFSDRGIALLRLARFEAAWDSFDKAVGLRPGYAAALTNRGAALHALGRLDEAVADHDRAIALQTGHAQAHLNRANALVDLGRSEEALPDYRKAIELDPESAVAHMNLAMCLLRLGQFEAGWREYEWRLRLDRALSARPYPQPLWTGQAPVAGKTILLRHEQGYGDTIQFCRYGRMLAEQGADVVASAPASLHGLLATVHPAIRLACPDETPDRFDFHCPMLSLPLAFGTDIDTIPAYSSYLAADGARRLRWADTLGPKRKPRIGIVWSGSPQHKNDARRSIPFDALQSILSQDFHWISLQSELRPGDVDRVSAHPGLAHFGDRLKTFDDTAALIDQLDLVITVDTSVAHLAGALGKPVWIMLPLNADWRWLRDRSDSPWYPTATLFRQDVPGDWSGVLQRVRDQLDLMA